MSSLRNSRRPSKVLKAKLAFCAIALTGVCQSAENSAIFIDQNHQLDSVLQNSKTNPMQRELPTEMRTHADVVNYSTDFEVNNMKTKISQNQITQLTDKQFQKVTADSSYLYDTPK